MSSNKNLTIYLLFLAIYCTISYTVQVSILDLSLLSTNKRVCRKLRLKKPPNGPSIDECLQAAEEYLEMLLLKNSLYSRVSLTEKYWKLMQTEIDSQQSEDFKKKYKDSQKKMVKISQKLSENGKFDELFQKLLECLKFFGEDFSPNNIYTRNAHKLRYLSSVNKLGS